MCRKCVKTHKNRCQKCVNLHIFDTCGFVMSEIVLIFVGQKNVSYGKRDF